MASQSSLLAGMPPVAREMAAASCAMTATSVVFNPFDVVKTKLQTQNQLSKDASKRIYTGTLHCARRCILEDGLVRGLWLPGLIASIMRDIVNGGIRMGGYAAAVRALHEQVPWGAPSGALAPTFGTRVLAGLLTGFTGAILANPTDVVKVRLMAEAGTVSGGVYVTGLYQGQPPSPGALVSMWRLASEEGIARGLFRGVGANCARAALVTSGQMSSYDQTKQLLAANPFGPFHHEGVRIGFSAFVSGLIAASVAAPVDLVRSRVMDDARGAGVGCSSAKYGGAMDCVIRTIKAEGPLALWKGWAPSYLRLGPHFMVSLPLLEFLRSHLFGLTPL
mmetsp:Transcript_23025/g.64765  ORF Transcript_23025/g.64765 Transcript_23025/m.64765 type:complete len:335 (-) Transcript_23025:141-1145(-)|eukprot:CAMPEP_0177389658 /NCGR_PEP_ID=MMETSP0368-20130122/52700_1 /TAXON_ID=447022 ORGANISM="Scrippsiella hangoei-like, Strain SHHI-4" /NCGR_SAMPLE_ID=MMETSP0368 /ASSEMBLY_ACC=CAM_ASM_000363 /LENGTH=334 /DNA_ID=CAMNT_0018855119 /DNA_START=36 /DNA_END=1040 /DNA_ORIENTATION=+